MPDGVVLLTDVYHPVGVDDAPTLLERTPYGRQGIASGAGPEFAARGYRYVLQACRGTDGSGGSHSYFAEAPDGRATADWIAEQTVVRRPARELRRELHGLHAVGAGVDATAAPPGDGGRAVDVGAQVLVVPGRLAGARGDHPVGPRRGHVQQADRQARSSTTSRRKRSSGGWHELRAGFDHLPLGDVIRHLTGEDLPLYQDQLAHARARRPVLGRGRLPRPAPRLGRSRSSWSTAGTTTRCPACSRTTRSCATRPRRCACASAPVATSAAAARAA